MGRNIPNETSQVAAPPLALSKTRLTLTAGIFMLGYFAVAVRLVDLTLLQPNHAGNAPAPADVRSLDHPLRADILDRNGEIMATSLTVASVYADATLVDDPAALAEKLSRILPSESRSSLQEKLASGKKFVWLKRDVMPKQEYAINALGAPALNFQEEGRRIYPGGGLASHVLGYTDVDGSGISGVEKAFDDRLANGVKPLSLTIDLRLQHIMRQSLTESIRKFSAKAAAGLIMDVNSGEVLALVSLPDYDPHHPQDVSDDMLFNRVSLGVSEMGSTFKLFSTAAVLDSGEADFGTIFDASTPIKYGKFTISDYHAKNRVLTVPEIFIYSSNIGTARMALKLGARGVEGFYRRMGFFAPAPIELPERGQPLYPKPWRDLSTITTSFGHGIAITPLHMARAAAALVNGGILITPTLEKSESQKLSTPVGSRVVKPQTSSMIRQLMELTVAAGTGSKAYVEGYDVGGKTGTAEKNMNGRYVRNALLSSFLGVFPIHDPRYVVLAILDEPQGIPETQGYATGGWTAAPVVAEVVSRMGPLYRIAPDMTSPRTILKDMAIYMKDKKEGQQLATPGTDH